MRFLLLGLLGGVSFGLVNILLGKRGGLGYLLGVGVGFIVMALFPA